MLSKKRKRQIVAKTLACSYTFVFGLYSFLTIFIPVSSVLPDYEKTPWYLKIAIAILFASIPLVLGAVVVLGIFCYYKRKTSYKYSLNGDGYHMVVEYGDFKDIMFPKRTPQRKYAVIIPVHNRVGEIFDYKESYGESIHGMWLKGICDEYLDRLSQKHKEELRNRSNKKHKEDLKNRLPQTKPEEMEETIGKGIFVPGTEVGVENVNYYFLFSNECLRDGTYGYKNGREEENYICAIQGAANACESRFRQQEVFMPLIGGGNASIHKTKKELTRMILEVFRFNGSQIRSDIHLVLYSGDREREGLSIFID